MDGPLDKQNNNFAHELDISLPSLHDYDVKLLNFTFNGECERKTTTFLFFFFKLRYRPLELNSKKNSLTFDKFSVMNQKP